MSNNHCQLNKPFKSLNNELTAVANDISRIYLQPELSDLILVVQNHRFPVHRVILAARSQYFRALLYSGLKESYQSEIEITNANEEAFEHVLKYIYKGTVNVSDMTDELVMELLSLVHQYGLMSIEKQISMHLSQNLALENVVSVLNVAVLYNIQDLMDRCLRFLDKHSADFLESEIIGGFTEAALCSVICRDSFCASEIIIFEAVVQWLQVNKANYSNDIANQILSHIRLCLISSSDLLWRVRPTGLIPAESILDAMESQLKANRLPHRGLMIPEENLAKPEWNSIVLLGGPDSLSLGQFCVPEHIDPSETIFGEHLIEEQGRILVRLGNPSKINLIRMYLLDREGRSYSYIVDVSLDQASWVTVTDYRRYICRSWQTLYFDPIVVQYIRITGTRNTVTRTFTILEFECLYTDNVRQHIDNIQIPNYNVASIEHYATVIEGVSRSRNSLLNGETKNYNWDSGYTCHQLGNGAIVVQLAQPYIVNFIRFLLWDLDDRSYSYTVEVSSDRSKWTMVADKSAELCSSYQNLYFSSQSIVFIRIIGTYNSANEVFHIVHLETYHQQIETSCDETIQDSSFKLSS